ncbi:TPA: hypothetical protein QCI16_000268 [Enterobacter ludwigii]|uniref:hypothetical protein n=1 Tax=Enterobacter ludwigii TaxID=299767 RepID=UPI0032F82A99|nr:hypothetical protein [Enterobacter ludwigii]HDR2596156.1 hypothetical protein [Enterobacter ludwigii]
MSDVIYDCYWEGPFSLDEVQDKIASRNNGRCLYQIYGDHPCYGNDVLLYIGRTTQGIDKRLEQHNNRFASQCEEVKIFIASCSVFTTWKEWKNRKRYELIDSETLNAIESLLIYAHQPAYNSTGICQPNFSKRNFRIFNTYRRKALMPEISTLFYRDDVHTVECDNLPEVQ